MQFITKHTHTHTCVWTLLRVGEVALHALNSSVYRWDRWGIQRHDFLNIIHGWNLKCILLAIHKLNPQRIVFEFIACICILNNYALWRCAMFYVIYASSWKSWIWIYVLLIPYICIHFLNLLLRMSFTGFGWAILLLHCRKCCSSFVFLSGFLVQVSKHS